MKPPLTPADLKRLRAIVDQGLELERHWPAGPQGMSLLTELKDRVAACTEAEGPELRRLAFHARDLTEEMTGRHLAAILVPFERLLGRALRDDDFMVSESDAPERASTPAPAIVIADNLRSAFNVGAILRTSEALGFSAVWLSGYTPTPEQEKTARTSLGAQEFLPWEQVPRAEEAVARAKAEGYTVIALETAGVATDLDDFVWPERAALLLGNERFGIERGLLAQADHVLRIPLHGRKNSLNVGIAFGIAAHSYRQSLAARSRALLDALDSSRVLTVRPIGRYRGGARHPYEARRQGVLAAENLGTVELEAGHQFEQALEDLDGFSHIWLIYQFDRNHNWKPKTLPPRGPRVKRGVFSTRSPYRPNPIGLSAVELLSVEGRRLTVRGSDLLDGTPILDIKPYLSYADCFTDAKSGWTEGLSRDAFAVHFTAEAERLVSWLTERGVDQLEGFVRAQLEFDPLDDERKRVSTVDERLHRLSYRTWRADFTVDFSARSVLVERILSGYSARDLDPATSLEDRHGDKELHREFNDRFEKP